MVDALYIRLEATARRLLAKYGKSPSGDQIDPAVIRQTAIGTPHNPIVTETAYGCTLADIGYSLTNRSETLILVGDKVGIMSTDIDIVPQLADKLVIDGQRYNFVDVAPLNPGGLTVIYEYHARR